MPLLPVLDASNFTFTSDEARFKFGQDLIQSFQDHGFVKLVNYDVDEAKVESLRDLSGKFFNLPANEKDEISCVRGPHPQRGWSCMGSEKTGKIGKKRTADLNPDELTDEREHFDAGPLEDDQYPNQWPRQNSFPSFQPLMESFYEICQAISLRIMASMEDGLNLKPGTLAARCQKAASEIRLNRYPSVSLQRFADGKVKRTWPHTDFGIITLLFQDEIGGLELEDRLNPGTFLPVTPTPLGQKKEMVVNISDTFQRWSNDKIRAGLHQVSVPTEWKNATEGILPERHSCVFFFKASRDVSVGPLPEFVTDSNPAKYDDITALEYQKQMTRKLY